MDSVSITFRIDADQDRKLRELAKREDRSTSAQLRRVLAAYLAQQR